MIVANHVFFWRVEANIFLFKLISNTIWLAPGSLLLHISIESLKKHHENNVILIDCYYHTAHSQILGQLLFFRNP